MKTVRLYLNNAGHCWAKGSHAIKGHPGGDLQFGALFGLIDHPEKGWVLFDTGYTDRFHTATRRFPNKVYALMTRVYIPKAEEVQAQLRTLGVQAADIRHIIISHFHADHVAGLLDFPNAEVYCTRRAYEHTMRLPRWRAFAKGVLKALLPANLPSRVRFVEEVAALRPNEIFGRHYDLFADGSLLLYDLPGHAAGQLGLRLCTARRQYFLVADACWTHRAYREGRLPNPIVRLFFDSWPDYLQSVARIRRFHEAHPEVCIVPTHCGETTGALIPASPDLDVL